MPLLCIPIQRNKHYIFMDFYQKGINTEECLPVTPAIYTSERKRSHFEWYKTFCFIAEKMW